ncbi:hypothetical protein QBC39DRAFT_381370 [Podospora conica]|nr:hypothetical protein QBC39DRAFT_381370 [Schizothecium conicum]
MIPTTSLAALLGATIAAADSRSAIEPRQERPPVVSAAGNWRTLPCELEGYDYGTNFDLTPTEQWVLVDCPTAWSDVINEWKNEYWPRQSSMFSSFVMSRYGRAISAECGTVSAHFNVCPSRGTCSGHPGGVNPAGAEVSNALARIHEIFYAYYELLPSIGPELINPYHNLTQDLKLISYLLNSRPNFKTSTVGVAILASAASIFKSDLQTRPYFSYHPASLRASLTTLAQALATNISALNPLENPSLPDGPGFSSLLDTWKSVTQRSALHLFRGSNQSIDRLTSLIDDGRMGRGVFPRGRFAQDWEWQQGWKEAERGVGIAFHMVAIPAMWEDAGAGAVVVPGRREEGCEDPTGSGSRPEGVDKKTAEKTWVCDGGRLWYLVGAKGGKLGAPRGLEELDGALVGSGKWGRGTFGGVGRGDLVAAAVRTFNSNGGRNGGEPDFGENSTLVMELYDRGIESPGLVRLPVCSAEEAARNGKKKDVTWDVYPCDMIEGSVEVPASGASRLQGGPSGGVVGQMMWAGLVMVCLVWL